MLSALLRDLDLELGTVKTAYRSDLRELGLPLRTYSLSRTLSPNPSLDSIFVAHRLNIYWIKVIFDGQLQNFERFQSVILPAPVSDFVGTDAISQLSAAHQ